MKSELDITKLRFRIVKRLRKHMDKAEGACGDYHGKTIDALRDSDDPLAEQMTLIHELVEFFMISNIGLTWKDIDNFDLPDDEQTKDYKKFIEADKISYNIEKQIIGYIKKHRKKG